MWTAWRALRLPAVIVAFLLLYSVTLVAVPPGSARGPRSAVKVSSAAIDTPTFTVPAGTQIYLRLETPVSTASSHLDERVEAETERAVVINGGIAIPVGAVFIGRIAKLVPFSRPSKRAKLLLKFNRLKLPRRDVIPVACHVNNVDNAREKVLADGTIQGILPSELPVRLLYSAIKRMESRSGTAHEGQEDPQTPLVSPRGSINYPAGTEFSVVLDKPLKVSGHFKAEFARRIPVRLKEEVMEFLADAPRRVVSRKGNQAGPVNVVLIGSKDMIQTAFEKAGWTEARKENASSVWKTFEAMVKREGYSAAPMSTLYLYGRPQEMAFEKMLNTFAKRDHLRIWKAPTATADGRPIWLVAASHDNGFVIRPEVISHFVDPNVDLERAKVGADLGTTRTVAAEALVSVSNPARSGLTASGGKWESDGKILVIDLKPQLETPAA